MAGGRTQKGAAINPPAQSSKPHHTQRASIVLLAGIGVALLLGAVARSAVAPVPSFRLAADLDTGTVCEAFAMGDLNEDGHADLAVGCAAFTGGLSVYFNNGSGRFRSGGDYLLSDTGDHLVASVAIGDLNGDGAADLVAAAGALSVLINRGDGTFLQPVDYRAGGASSVAIADLDRDGKADLVAGDKNSVSVLLNRGDGTFLSPVEYGSGRGGYFGWRSLALGDTNGDGVPDVLTPNDQAGTVSVLLGKGDGTLLPKHDYAAERHPASIAVGDLNGDGRLDAATAGLRSESEADGAVSVLLNRGGGALAHQRDYGGGGSVGIGDLNGDGRPDLATTSGLGVSVLLNGGDGRFRPRLDYRSSAGDSVAVAIGELNGDRRLDLAVANTTLLHNDSPSDLAVLINTPGLCNVQYVKGLALAAAKQTLARVRCRVGKVTRAYSKVRRGRVISQKPRFGAVLPGGARVNLVVSKGRIG